MKSSTTKLGMMIEDLEHVLADLEQAWAQNWGLCSLFGEGSWVLI